jgi:hypothetical protein
MTLSREERIREIGEHSYEVLRDSYRMVQELKVMVDRYHVNCLQGKATDFDSFSAIKLTMDRLFDGMERYLRPELDPQSAHPDAMTEIPPAGKTGGIPETR